MPENILNEVAGYGLFSINVSSYNYIDNKLLVGEIFISNTSVNAILSTNSSYSVRDAIRNPDFNFMTNILDDKTLLNWCAGWINQSKKIKSFVKKIISYL